jgi:hypothetical protein
VILAFELLLRRLSSSSSSRNAATPSGSLALSMPLPAIFQFLHMRGCAMIRCSINHHREREEDDVDVKDDDVCKSICKSISLAVW